MVENLVNLKTLIVSNCSMMEQVIVTEEFGDAMTKVTFRQLEFLQLENLPKPKRFIFKCGEENVAISNDVALTNFSLFDEKVTLLLLLFFFALKILFFLMKLFFIGFFLRIITFFSG